jgi:hypothetical protein
LGAGQKFQLGPEVPTTEHLSGGITPSSGPQIERPYMFFDQLNERNAMVKSVLHFDNFIEWIFFSVNKVVDKVGMIPEVGMTLESEVKAL